MGKRRNIANTARNTRTLVWQNRAEHLREQGVLPAHAGPAEAEAHDRATAKAEFEARIAEHDANASPHRGLWFGLAMAVLTAVMWALGASPILVFIAGLITFTLLAIWALSAGIDTLFKLRDRRVS